MTIEASTREKLTGFFTVPVSISLVVLLFILFIAIRGWRVATHNPNAMDFKHMLSGPSSEHLLGTDKNGRDLFSRLVVGSRVTILSAFGVVLLSAVIAVPLGMAAGYYGGLIDKILMRIFDVILSFPSLLLAFVFVSAFGRGILNAVVALGIVYVPMLAKLARSTVLVEKNKTYVEAARSIGYSGPYIVMTEILPNCVDTLAVQMALDIGYAILDLASMSFLGLGVQPPTADWGAMLEEGWVVITTSPLVALAPGALIVTTVIAINIFCDGVRSYLDPSQRKLPSARKFKRILKATSRG